MKALPTLAAIAIAMALLMSPMMAAAAGSISFTSPTSGSSYKGSQSYTISGTVSPVPTSADSVSIKVTGPAGVVDADTASVSLTTGAFSYATAVGNPVNPSAWPTGTYTISATDDFGATASTTFTYTSSSAPAFNETRALLNIQGNLTIIQKEIKNLNNDLHGNVTAIQATQTAQGTTLAGIQQSLSSLTTTVSGLVTSVGSINTAVSGMSTQITTAANNALNAANAVSSTQTYVLVVAVLAAITLVLELAILVRKVS